MLHNYTPLAFIALVAKPPKKTHLKRECFRVTSYANINNINGSKGIFSASMTHGQDRFHRHKTGNLT